jgi:O-antigen ligase
MKYTVSIYKIILAILLFILFSDINNSYSSYVNKNEVFSYLILLLTVILFVKSFQIGTKVPTILITYIIFYLFYLIYGTLIYHLFNTTYGDPIIRIRSLAPAVFIIIACSKWFLLFHKRNEFKFVLNTITIALLFNTIAIIYSYYSGLAFFSENASDRSSGTIASVNQAGSTAVLTQVFILYHALKLNIAIPKRIFLLLLYTLAVFAAIVTFSKAALLGSILVFILYSIYIVKTSIDFGKSKFLLNKYLLLIIPFLFVGILSIFINEMNLFDKFNANQIDRLVTFTDLLKGNLNDQTTTNRTSIASYALDQIKDDYYMGRGLDSFHRMSGIGLGPHNQFLLILGETGILGLMFFLAFVTKLFFSIFKTENRDFKILKLGIFIVILIASMVSHTILYVKTYIIMIVVLSIASDRILPPEHVEIHD